MDDGAFLDAISTGVNRYCLNDVPSGRDCQDCFPQLLGTGRRHAGVSDVVVMSEYYHSMTTNSFPLTEHLHTRGMGQLFRQLIFTGRPPRVTTPTQFPQPRILANGDVGG